MNEYIWPIIGTYIMVFFAGFVGGLVSMAIQATKLYRKQANNDIKELNRVLSAFTQGNNPQRMEEGDEWKVRCVHGNSIMTECVACTEANRRKQ